MSELYKINSPAVISEIIDGEAVIMNLTSGNYFSAQDTGRMIWMWIEAGYSLPAIARRLGEHFDVAEPVLSAALDAFVADLLANGLIVEADMPATVAHNDEKTPAERAPFLVPTLAIYTDMQDVLLLDPIHDVDSVGWPTVAPLDGPPLDGLPGAAE